MSETATTHRMYKFRLYRNDQPDKSLRHKLLVASLAWNDFIALQKRYYGLTGKCITLTAMNNPVLKLRKTKWFALGQAWHTQSCQDVCRRVDNGYQQFFTGLNKRPPTFRNAKKYRSFTFPQSGGMVRSDQISPR